MLHQLSQMITDKSLKKNWISNDQREICCYAIERRLGSTLFLLLLLLVALVAGEFLRTISFVSVFFVFRRRMGGWHANSALLCFILSLSIVLISIFFIGPAAERLPFSVILSVNILFSVILFILPPAFPPQLHFTAEESRANTKRKNILLLILMALQILLGLTKASKILTYIALSLIATFITVMIQALVNKNRKKESRHEST